MLLKSSTKGCYKVFYIFFPFILYLFFSQKFVDIAFVYFCEFHLQKLFFFLGESPFDDNVILIYYLNLALTPPLLGSSFNL